MKAWIHDRYGPPDVLRMAEVDRPEPRPDEIRVRVHATTVTSGDCRVRAMNVPRGFGVVSRLVFGITRPRRRILGSELAGVVDAVGAGVRGFAPGDRVFAMRGLAMGAHAEFVCMPERGAIARIPDGLAFDEAAALSFGGTTAMDFLRRANARSGERLLVVGASGAVGSAAVQFARHRGLRVTAVCSGANVERVRALGAEAVVDYTRDALDAVGGGHDLVLDAVGAIPPSRYRPLLSPRARLMLVVADLPQTLAGPWSRVGGGPRVIVGTAPERAEDLRTLAQWAVEGVWRPMIDRRLAFDRMIDAHRYVETGRKRGNLVVMVAPPA